MPTPTALLRCPLLIPLLAIAPAVQGCVPYGFFGDGFELQLQVTATLPCLIDSGPHASGVRDLQAVDLDADGHVDLLTAHAFNVDRIHLYRGLGGGLLAPAIAVDTGIDDPVALASGDFDADGHIDLVSLTLTEGALRLYRGDTAGLGVPLLIDGGRAQGNALVAGDFDERAGDDLVVIGQHSIDFFRSLGPSGLVKEVILSTDSSPDVLECMALASVDADADGDLDVVVAETRGGVLYRNDGNGLFTPEVFTAQRRILVAIQTLDADGNPWPDVVVQVSSGELRLYHDIGIRPANEGVLLFDAGPAQLGSIATVDLTGDGWQDLQFASRQTLWHSSNLQGQGFAAPVALLGGDGRFYNEVGQADVDGDGRHDLLWSAVNGWMGYFPSERMHANRADERRP